MWQWQWQSWWHISAEDAQKLFGKNARSSTITEGGEGEGESERNATASDAGEHIDGSPEEERPTIEMDQPPPVPPTEEAAAAADLTLALVSSEFQYHHPLLCRRTGRVCVCLLNVGAGVAVCVMVPLLGGAGALMRARVLSRGWFRSFVFVGVGSVGDDV